MVKFTNLNDSIEGVRFDISARDIKSKSITRENIDGASVSFYMFKTKISAIAEIIEEYSPLRFFFKSSSHLNIGDTLEAQNIEFKLHEKAATKLLSNYSSTHSINNFKSDGFSFGIIKIPFRFILEKLNKDKRLSA